MRATVCELPYQPDQLEAAWAALCAHTRSAQSALVLLPEFAFVEPVWESLPADPARWGAAVALSGPGRWSYVYGRMTPDDAPEILQGATAYAATTDGIVPWRERVTIFRKRSLARIPPIG